MTIRLLALTAIFLVSACASNSFNAKLTPESEKGAILVSAPMSFFPYYLQFGRIDHEANEIVLPPARIGQMNSLSNRGGYMILQLQPGPYVLVDFVFQTGWSLCFHEESIRFDVKAGQIAYLGEFDGSSQSSQVAELARENNDTKAAFERRFRYSEDIGAPLLTPPDAESLEAAQVFVSENMVEASAEVVPAEITPVSWLQGGPLCSGSLK